MSTGTRHLSTRRVLRRAGAMFLMIFAASAPVDAATLFGDGFESGALASPWSVSGTADGRASVTSEFEPASGARHLVLDDSVEDNRSSVAEATLKLDLAFKKNVVLSFKAKSLGNEPHHPYSGNFSGSRAYDGVAMSIDGGSTWRLVHSLATAPTSWTTTTVTLDQIATGLGGKLSSDVRIRFSAYDNSPAPEDGIAIDDVLITGDEDRQSFVELPTPIIEGTGPQTGWVLLTFTPASDLTLHLNASPAGQLIMPATVVVPAGQRAVSFELSAAEDTAVNLTRTITVTATADGVTANSGAMTIYDDDAPIPVLSLPAQVQEGDWRASDNATISIDRPATRSLTMTITVTPRVFSSSTSVTIAAGQTSAKFSIYSFGDNAITGNVSATVTGSAPGIQTASAQTTFVDDDPRTLSLTLPPAVQENMVVTCTVTIPGTLREDLGVSLNSSDPMTARVPASVVIPAGSTSATFLLTPQDNSTAEGGRKVTVSAHAPTFTSGSMVTTITDKEIAGYRAMIATDIVDLAKPVSFTVSATDLSGHVVGGANHTVDVEIVAPDGSTRPASPSRLTLTGATTTGTVTLPPDVVPPLRLRFRDADGRAGDSHFFDLLRTVHITAADVVWDATRGRFYASVPATAPTYAHQVVAIDAQTLQVTASVTVGHNPGRLALTSGGEALYVGLNANGKVARINPASMTVVSEFAVGQGRYGETYYAYDMTTVAGQPDLLLIVRSEKWEKYSGGVFVYDNGVPRAKGVGGENVEPSSEPTIFFTAGADRGLYRVHLGPDGLTIAKSNPGLEVPDIAADGDLLVSRSKAIDVVTLNSRGSFSTTADSALRAWRPDRAANRVYFTEAQGQYYAEPVDKIAAYDASSLALVRRSTMPAVSSASSFIRWGSNGLAFRTSNSITIVGASLLVPTAEPADLSVAMIANPASASAGQRVTYSAQVTNHGPAIARNAVLTMTMSDGQRVEHLSASAGAPGVSGSVATLNIGDLQPGSSVSVTLHSTPETTGSVSCTAQIAATSRDASSANDFAFSFVPVGFNPGADTTNELRLPVNNVVYDQARSVLWATFPKSVAPPLGGALIAIDPTTGLISNPMPLSGDPRASCIALSGNSRYLYVGLSEAQAVVRVDLGSSPYEFVHVPLGMIGYDRNFAGDIEVLDGDGRSFVVTDARSRGVAVYDDTTQRPGSLPWFFFADRVERTAQPGKFLVIATTVSDPPASIINVGPDGITTEQTTYGTITGDIRSSGNLVLSSSGQIADNNTLTVKAKIGISGQPCLDTPNGRAYLVSGNEIRAFTTEGAPAGTLPLPLLRTDNWATACIRWGRDGFAIAGLDKLYVTRWSVAAPTRDDNGNGLADRWEQYYFGSSSVDPAGDPDGDGVPNALEYFFATSPLTATAPPLQIGVENGSAGHVIHLVYRRRAGLPATSYRYEVSADLNEWISEFALTETVLATELIDGIEVETIDAAIPAPRTGRGFARVRWIGR